MLPSRIGDVHVLCIDWQMLEASPHERRQVPIPHQPVAHVFGGFTTSLGKEERERLALAYSVELPGYGLQGGWRSCCPALWRSPLSPGPGHGGHAGGTLFPCCYHLKQPSPKKFRNFLLRISSAYRYLLSQLVFMYILCTKQGCVRKEGSMFKLSMPTGARQTAQAITERFMHCNFIVLFLELVIY